MTDRQVLARLLSSVAPFRLQAAGSVLLSFLTVGASVGLMATSGYLISKAALHPQTILLLWVPIVGVRFFGLARGLLRYAERLVSHDLTFRLLGRMRTEVYQAIEPESLHLADERRYGDLLNTVTNDVDTLQNFYLRALAPPLAAFLTVLLTFGVLAAFHLSLGVVGALGLVVAGVGVPLLSSRLTQGPGRRVVDERAQLAVRWTDALHGMTELAVYNQTERALGELEQTQAAVAAEQQKIGMTGAVTGAVMNGLMQLSMLAAVCTALPLVHRSQLPGVDLAVVAMTVLAAFEAVVPLPGAFSSLQQCIAAGRRLWSLAGPDVTVPIPNDGGPGNADAGPAAPRQPTGSAGLHLMDVSVRYAASDRNVLSHVCFDLEQGQRVAVIGPSGSGKTTLLRLITREVDGCEGSISLAGSDLATVAAEAVRDQLAVVPQTTYLFNGTIAANLRLGNPDASMEDLRQAARSAQLLDFIDSLADGFETTVGELGMQLSGGQRQRLALARALLRKAPFLLLDEPTTGLDRETASRFMTTLLSALNGRSLLLVTHQTIGLEAMDEVVVLNDGRVVDRGSHRELLRRPGLYARMWQQQGEA